MHHHAFTINIKQKIATLEKLPNSVPIIPLSPKKVAKQLQKNLLPLKEV